MVRRVSQSHGKHGCGFQASIRDSPLCLEKNCQLDHSNLPCIVLFSAQSGVGPAFTRGRSFREYVTPKERRPASAFVRIRVLGKSTPRMQAAHHRRVL